MKHVAILLAGGSGARMGGSVEDKILVSINGSPVFAHVLKAFVASGTQDAFIIVVRDNAQRKELASIVQKERLDLPVFYARN